MTPTLFEITDRGRLAPLVGIGVSFADTVCSMATAHRLMTAPMFADRPALEEDDVDCLAEAEADTREWSRLCRRVGRDDVADRLVLDLDRELLPCPHCAGSGLVTVAPFTDIECEDCQGEGYR